jgi:hypothetical protein
MSKGVFCEMFKGCVVDAYLKIRYLEIFGELKDLLLDLL